MKKTVLNFVITFALGLLLLVLLPNVLFMFVTLTCLGIVLSYVADYILNWAGIK